MAITTYKPISILVNFPPEIAAQAKELKGKQGLTRYIVDAVACHNKRTRKKLRKETASSD